MLSCMQRYDLVVVEHESLAGSSKCILGNMHQPNGGLLLIRDPLH